MDLYDRVASTFVEDDDDLWAIGKEMVFEALFDEIKFNVDNSSGGLNEAKLSRKEDHNFNIKSCKQTTRNN